MNEEEQKLKIRILNINPYKIIAMKKTMRKTMILVALALLLPAVTNGVRAQRPVGDTLASIPYDYFYQYEWSVMEDTSWRTRPGDFVLIYSISEVDEYEELYPGLLRPGNHISGPQMFAERPIKILGIAACAYMGDSIPAQRAYVLDTTLEGRVTDSLILYRITGKGPQRLAAGPWRFEDPHRYMAIPPLMESLRIPMPSALYEVMFDHPEVVVDSFLVAGTAYNNEGTYVGQYHPESWWCHYPTRYPTLFKWVNALDTTNISWLKWRDEAWFRWSFRSAYRGGPNSRGEYGLTTRYIYPIIDPEFDTVLCDEVRDLRVAEATDTTLTLMWNGGNNVQWEVQYVEVNGWDVLTERTTVPMVTLTGLRERTNYMVRVRGMCEWDTEYGPWSEWADVYTGAHHDDPPESISNLGRFTQMMPNPASGQVTVLSSYRLSRVVVYDLAGHAVLEVADDGLTTTFDVSGLSKGVYVVAIHTPAGIATKRLVVEN